MGLPMGLASPGRNMRNGLVLGLLAAWCLACETRVFRVPTAAMEPTIPAGSTIRVRLLPDEDREHLSHGQIVVFEYPLDPTVHYLKRIVGLGGDVVEIRQHRLVLNGQPIDEPYIQILDSWAGDFGPVEVPGGHAFVLGDNRARSADSRMWGFVRLTAITGIVELD